MEILPVFTGKLDQVPPNFSALRISEKGVTNLQEKILNRL